MENIVREYHGTLTREGIEEIIKQGGSVLINEEVIDSIDKIPDANKLYALALKGKVVVRENCSRMPHINLFVSPVINNTFPEDYRHQTDRTYTTNRVEADLEEIAKKIGSTPLPSSTAYDVDVKPEVNVKPEPSNEVIAVQKIPQVEVKVSRWSQQNILLFTTTIGILVLCAFFIYMNYRTVTLPVQKIELITTVSNVPMPSPLPSVVPTPVPTVQIIEKTTVNNVEKNIYSGSYRLETTNNAQELMVFFDKKFIGTGYNIQFEVKTEESVRLSFKILDMIKYEDRVKLKLMVYGKFKTSNLNVFAYE